MQVEWFNIYKVLRFGIQHCVVVNKQKQINHSLRGWEYTKAYIGMCIKQ